MLYLTVALTNPWAAERHWWRRTAHAAWKLRLIGTAAMFDAVRKSGVYRDTAEMEIGFTGVTQGPAANALVQIQQRRFVGHFRAWLCRYKAAWRCWRNGCLLIAGALTHETARSDRNNAWHRRCARDRCFSGVIICEYWRDRLSHRCSGAGAHRRSGGRCLCRRCSRGLFRRGFFVRVVGFYR